MMLAVPKAAKASRKTIGAVSRYSERVAMLK